MGVGVDCDLLPSGLSLSSELRRSYAGGTDAASAAANSGAEGDGGRTSGISVLAEAMKAEGGVVEVVVVVLVVVVVEVAVLAEAVVVAALAPAGRGPPGDLGLGMATTAVAISRPAERCCPPLSLPCSGIIISWLFPAQAGIRRSVGACFRARLGSDRSGDCRL
jgi:hypothetical protein